MTERKLSEFGAGVVVCLAKFSEHLANHHYERMERPLSGLFEAPERALSVQIEMWMSGASDHFYDLDRGKAPPSLVALADLSLLIGHGFTGETWTMDHVRLIRELWQKACLEVDEMLGTEPDWGEW